MKRPLDLWLLAGCLCILVAMTTSQRRITEISEDGRSCIVRFNATQTIYLRVSRVVTERFAVQGAFEKKQYRQRTKLIHVVVPELIIREVIRCCDNFVNVSGVCTQEGLPNPRQENNDVVVIVVAAFAVLVALVIGVLVTFLCIRKRKERKTSDRERMQDFYPNRVSREESPMYEDFSNRRSDPSGGTHGHFSTVAAKAPSSGSAVSREQLRGAGERRQGTVTSPQIYDRLDPGTRSHDLYQGLADLHRTSLERDSHGYLLPAVASAPLPEPTSVSGAPGTAGKGRQPLPTSTAKGDKPALDLLTVPGFGGKGRVAELRGAEGARDSHGYTIVQDDPRASCLSAEYSYVDSEEQGWGVRFSSGQGSDNARSYQDAASKESSYNDALSKKSSYNDALSKKSSYNDALSKKSSYNDALSKKSSYNDALSKTSGDDASSKDATYHDAVSK